MNGVLHNPANERRTTAGVFHIAEGGLPIPDDKLAVPKAVFAKLLSRAFQPPEVDMVLPYSANQPNPAACFVSLHLRPLVAPEVPGSVREKRMETRFIVPGGTVANLDFVEGIFGNGGDPYLPENDAALDPAIAAAPDDGRPLVLVGHSMGGLLTLRAGLRHRVDAQVLLMPAPPAGLLRDVGRLALTDPVRPMATTEAVAGGAASGAVVAAAVAVVSVGAVALAVAFVLTVPVNRWLIARGKGHAVVHQYHH